MVVVTNGLLSSDNCKTRLYREYNMTRETADQDISSLKEWISKQPHLPDVSSMGEYLDQWLEGVLLLTKNSLERAKHSVDLYFSARAAVPDHFQSRDVRHNRELRDSFEHVKVVLLPGLTDEGHRVLLMKIDCADASQYSLLDHMKRCSMVVDYYLQHGVDFSGLHVVHDLERIGLGHLSRFSLQLMREMAISMKAYPCRIPKITLINTPYFVDKVLALFRPFMAPKLMARVTSYKDASQLLDLLPAHLVPQDYGGEAPSLQELNEFWRIKMENSADFFALCDSLKTDEMKRASSKKFITTEFGQNGTFRKLAVD